VNSFTIKNNRLHVEKRALADIAREFSTPCYVYSKDALTQAFNNFSAGFADCQHLVCFAVKANPNLAILNLFARLGAGFDIVCSQPVATRRRWCFLAWVKPKPKCKRL
jgi:diaminopimelate decarboxylase